MSKLLEEIEEYQNKYYSTNKKSVIFKSNEKTALANEIAQNFNMETLLDMMCFPVPDKNIVVIDYLIFKLFANPNNYELITNHILGNFHQKITVYGNFQCHLNIHSFTVSAAQRYKSMIEIFCKNALASNTPYSEKIQIFAIYNAPCMLQQISNIFLPFVNPNVKDKVTIYDKNDSNTCWNHFSSFRKSYIKNNDITETNI